MTEKNYSEMNHQQVNEFRKKYAEFIDKLHERMPICWFCTITLRDDMSPLKAQTLLKAYLKDFRERWFPREERNRRNILVIVAEEYMGRDKNTPHFHLLIGGGDAHRTTMKYWEKEAFRRFGNSHFEKYDPTRDGLWYMTKHISHGADIYPLYTPSLEKKKAQEVSEDDPQETLFNMPTVNYDMVSELISK